MIPGRIQWVDVAKGIGIICVVVGHIISAKILVNHIIFLFHMPLFFFISGVLYRENTNNISYIIKKIRNILIPFLSIFILVYSCFLLFYVQDYSLNLVINDIRNFAIGGRSLRVVIDGAFNTMWFLTCLFLTQIIYNLMQTKLKQSVIHIIVFLMLIGSYINSFYFSQFWLAWDANVILAAIPIYHIGYMYRQKAYKENWIPIIIGAVVASLSLIFLPENRYDMMLNFYGIPLLTLACSIICILAIKNIATFVLKKNILVAFFSELGKASLIIMAFHLPYYLLLRKYFDIKSIPAILAIIILSYITYRIFAKFRITEILFLGKGADTRTIKNK